MSDKTREALINSKLKRENYETEEDFEESLNYWMGRQGQILSLTSPLKARRLS